VTLYPRFEHIPVHNSGNKLKKKNSQPTLIRGEILCQIYI
jgi:hypothetical protein